MYSTQAVNTVKQQQTNNQNIPKTPQNIPFTLQSQQFPSLCTARQIYHDPWPTRKRPVVQQNNTTASILDQEEFPQLGTNKSERKCTQQSPLKTDVIGGKAENANHALNDQQTMQNTDIVNKQKKRRKKRKGKSNDSPQETEEEKQENLQVQAPLFESLILEKSSVQKKAKGVNRSFSFATSFLGGPQFDKIKFEPPPKKEEVRNAHSNDSLSKFEHIFEVEISSLLTKHIAKVKQETKIFNKDVYPYMLQKLDKQLPNIYKCWEIIKYWPVGTNDRKEKLLQLQLLMKNFQDPAFSVMALTLFKLYHHKDQDPVKNKAFKKLKLTAIFNLVDDLRFEKQWEEFLRKCDAMKYGNLQFTWRYFQTPDCNGYGRRMLQKVKRRIEQLMEKKEYSLIKELLVCHIHGKKEGLQGMPKWNDFLVEYFEEGKKEEGKVYTTYVKKVKSNTTGKKQPSQQRT